MTAPARDGMDGAAVGAAELRRAQGAVRTSILPGAPVESFRQADVEWCAAGAWRDNAPTIGACTLGTYVAGVPGLALPEGGMLGTEEPEVEFIASGSTHRVRSHWPAAGYPLQVTRSIALDADGALCAHYQVANAHTVNLPLIWGLTMPMAWDPEVSLELPVGARTRIAAIWGDGLPPVGSEFAWPSLRDGGRLLDLSAPSRLRKGVGILCFVELPRSSFAVRRGAQSLVVEGTPGLVTHARVFIDHEAPLPGRAPSRWWRRRPPHRSVVVGPTVGAPDVLSDAVGGWHAARWVNAGDATEWTVTIRAETPPLDEDPA